MLDGLSLIASMFTVIEALSQAVRYAAALYRASQEFEVLQVPYARSRLTL